MANKQCCTLPPVQAEYKSKGEFTTFAGLKSYVVGPTDTGKAVLFTYDVFGYSPQIEQGADLIASQGFRVVMPDFLVGQYATPDMFDGSEEGTKKRDAYLAGFPAKPQSQSEAFGKVVKQLRADGYSKVGAVGFCWGWKAIVTSSAVKDLDCVASCHPSFIDESDAELVDVPVALLPSGGEDKKTVDAVHAALEKKNPGKNFIKYYTEQVHGFAAARGNLKGGHETEAFKDAYEQLAKFFKANL